MKSITPLIVLLLFFIFLGYLILTVFSPAERPEGGQETPGFLCADGDTRPCTSGECEGISTCVRGVWAGCEWEKICTPGLRESCISQGCVYAVRECNGCGTGWSECHGLPASD